MEVLGLDIHEEILARLKTKDLIRYMIVCKSWNSLISSGRFVKSHLNYTLKQKAQNNETGDTRIVLAGPSIDDYKCDIVGSSNGLVCVRFDTELLVVNPSTLQVIKLESLPQIPDLVKEYFIRMGFGYDSSIDDYKVVIGFKNTCTNKYRFLVLTLRSNIWRPVAGELDYNYMFISGVLCNGAIHRLATDRNNNPIVVSFDLSKEVFKEIPTPMPLRAHDFHSGSHNLGTMKDRLCIFGVSSRTPFFDQCELWLLKTYNAQESESIWEQMLSPPPCDESPHQAMMNCIPDKSFPGHIRIWMSEEDSSAPVLVQRVKFLNGNTDHIWLSTISDYNHKYNDHAFVESLVSPRGIGNDNGNCNEGRVKRKMHNVISPDGDGRSVKRKRENIGTQIYDEGE